MQRVSSFVSVCLRLGSRRERERREEATFANSLRGTQDPSLSLDRCWTALNLINTSRNTAIHPRENRVGQFLTFFFFFFSVMLDCAHDKGKGIKDEFARCFVWFSLAVIFFLHFTCFSPHTSHSVISTHIVLPELSSQQMSDSVVLAQILTTLADLKASQDLLSHKVLFSTLLQTCHNSFWCYHPFADQYPLYAIFHLLFKTGRQDPNRVRASPS